MRLRALTTPPPESSNAATIYTSHRACRPRRLPEGPTGSGINTVASGTSTSGTSSPRKFLFQLTLFVPRQVDSFMIPWQINRILGHIQLLGHVSNRPVSVIKESQREWIGTGQLVHDPAHRGDVQCGLWPHRIRAFHQHRNPFASTPFTGCRGMLVDTKTARSPDKITAPPRLASAVDRVARREGTVLGQHLPQGPNSAYIRQQSDREPRDTERPILGPSR